MKDTHTQWHGISHLQIKQSHKHQISCGNCSANKRLDKPKTRTSMKTKRNEPKFAKVLHSMSHLIATDSI